MKKLFFFFAVVAWAIGLAAHVFAIMGTDLSQDPFVWLLHLGIFVVWIPAIIELKKTMPVPEDGKLLVPPRAIYLHVFKDLPRWLVLLVIASFFYGIVNFIVFFIGQKGTVDSIDGQYMLLDHGRLIREITEGEYVKIRANVVRGFSGHWLLFYSTAAAVLYPFKKD